MSLRARWRDARAAASLVWPTGLLTQARPLRLPQTLAALVRGGFGPHVPVRLHAAQRPDACALIDDAPDGVRRWTWAELDAACERVAAMLAGRGVGPGTRVALRLHNRAELVIAQQALLRRGAVAVALGTRLRAAELAHVLADARPVVSIVEAALAAELDLARAQVGDRSPCLVVDDAGANGWDAAVAAAPARAPRVGDTDDAGTLVYTSGTTGRPKGAHRSWRQTGLDSVADFITQIGMRADDRHLVVCPLYHSMAPAIVAILMSLGATCVIARDTEPEALLALMAREQITCTLLVPTLMQRLTALPAELRARHDVSRLRWVLSGAAPLAPDSARRFQDAFGPCVWNFYGATETGLVTLAGPRDHAARPGTIGRPLAGNVVRLLDERGLAVPPGEVGELFVENATLIDGYHGNAEATARARHGGAFSVGDLARRDADGYLYLASRTHDLVITGGVNVYPREVEDRLMAHPAIGDAAVFGVPDPEWGERVVAAVVVRDGHTLTTDDVIAWCRAALSDDKRPREVRRATELPRNPTGKLDKRALRAAWDAGALTSLR